MHNFSEETNTIIQGTHKHTHLRIIKTLYKLTHHIRIYINDLSGVKKFITFV